MTALKIVAVYDSETKRFRANCPSCPFVAVRAKRETALHLLSQHVAYEHDGKVGAA